ncbi:Spore germination protein YaaH [Caprobacter fermentans]|uniref:LysM peptidoglycan-binding domain-containing protein n=1 Tax=Caproicibacter fermentans TaxID=2576756 RepID=A0A6N8HXI7_9FIRM|nr:LysM peptidoglycan-binding domain-containing protein [Caproicibacter fermentans]MVB10378.1 Spore germination protein YaaH [Caproicibacter fermentans]OCN01920.1 spore gernimation protein [Clostridium sp. W14A]QNK40400.1 LysM peptidoglycan-binding domain-containing protein [Caproicibacter fermentans]
MVIYRVRPGDNIYRLSRLYGIPEQQIMEDNQIRDPQQLVVGQALVLMTDSVKHTVGSGQSLYSIAALYGISVDQLLEANPQITDPSRIQAGQVLTIPVTSQKLGSILVNGYVYPSVNRNTLNRTLPYLSFVSIFSYMAGADGALAPIEDEAVITAARAQNTAPLMVVTNMRPEGGFSSEVANAVLSGQQVQDTLLENITATMKQKNYYGLNIDFEYIYPRDRENYNNFLRKVVARMHSLGYIVTTSLAPKTSAGQQGLLYEAHDYPAHGEAVDYVILMTYEWGYTYGPARPVAPLNLVEEVIRYAVTVIPPNKILMGIPNYGYDWTLPFVRGSSARSLTNPGAVELAAQVGARILFDEEAQSPHFDYFSSDGKKHTVWFEDARSIRAKLELAHRYGLAGVSYWTANSYFSQNWLVLSSLFDVKKVL